MKKILLTILIVLIGLPAFGQTAPYILKLKKMAPYFNSAHLDTTGGTIHVIFSDSAKKIDTTYVGFQLYITNHSVSVSTTDNLFNNADITVGGQYFRINEDYKLDTSFITAQKGPELQIGVANSMLYSPSGLLCPEDTSQGVHPTYCIWPNGYGCDSGDQIDRGWDSASADSNGFWGANSWVMATTKWKYVLSFNPLDNGGGDKNENSFIRVSNDGITWTRPRVITTDEFNNIDTAWSEEPVVDPADFPGASTYLSDNCIFPDKTGKGWLAVRVSSSTSSDGIWVIPSMHDNPIEWDVPNKVRIYSAGSTGVPTIFLGPNGKYQMYLEQLHYQSDTINSATAWKFIDTNMYHSTADTAGINLSHASYTRWHNQVHMFAPSAGADGKVWLFVSDDGLTFNRVSKPVLQGVCPAAGDRYMGKSGDTAGVAIVGTGNAWDSSNMYFGCARWIEDGNGGHYHYIYSAQGYSLPDTGSKQVKWGIGYTDIFFGRKPVTIPIVEWLGHKPQDSARLSVPHWIGTTAYSFTDSTNTAAMDDTIKGIITIPEDMYLDSLIFKYILTAAGDSIDSTWIMGPDRSSGDNNTDSLYYSSGDSLKATTATRYVYTLGKHRVFAGDRFVVNFKLTLKTANDVIRCYYAKFWGRPR